jgi:hypothetical protein
MTEEKFEKDCNVCKIIDPIMMIQACMTNLNQNFAPDNDAIQHFERMNIAVKKIYKYILEDKKAK